MEDNRVAFADLLIDALTEHEKHLSVLCDKLEDLLNTLETILTTDTKALSTMLKYYEPIMKKARI